VIAQAARRRPGRLLRGRSHPGRLRGPPTLADPDHPTAQRRVLSVASPYINADSLVTSGLDLNVQASFYLPYDVKWTSNLDATTLFDFKYTQDGTTYNYVGKEAPYALSSGAGTPKNRLSWANTFEHGPVHVTGTMNYVSGMRSKSTTARPTAACTATPISTAA
jgi:iron complex outermembrane receptor protein